MSKDLAIDCFAIKLAIDSLFYCNDDHPVFLQGVGKGNFNLLSQYEQWPEIMDGGNILKGEQLDTELTHLIDSYRKLIPTMVESMNSRCELRHIDVIRLALNSIYRLPENATDDDLLCALVNPDSCVSAWGLRANAPTVSDEESTRNIRDCIGHTIAFYGLKAAEFGLFRKMNVGFQNDDDVLCFPV